MNFQDLNKRYYCKGLVVVYITISLIILNTGCHTTSTASKAKGGQQSRILEPRNGVPQPYTDPSPQQQISSVPSVLPKEPVQDKMPSTTVKQTASWTVSKSTRAPAPKIEKKILPIKTSPVIIKEPAPAPVREKPEPLPKVSESVLKSYTVKKGDTLWDIAQLYGISVKELAAANKMKANGILTVGKVLTIPPGGAYRPTRQKLAHSNIKTVKTTTNVPKKIRKQPLPSSGKYIVKKGDNLWEISQTFGLNLKKLQKINGLNNSDLLHPGQVLILVEPELEPVRDGGPTLSEETLQGGDVETEMDGEGSVDSEGETEVDVTVNVPGVTGSQSEMSKAKPNLSTISESVDLKNLPHYISADDTLESVAEMYGSEVKWILEANPKITVNDDLVEGMEIQVPCPDIK